MEKDIEDLKRILLALKDGDAGQICHALGDIIELAAGRITSEHAIACMSLAVANYVTFDKSREELLEIVNVSFDRAKKTNQLLLDKGKLTCENCGESMYLFNDNTTAVATRVLWCPKCTIDGEYAFVAKMPDDALALVVLAVDGSRPPRYYREEAIDEVIATFKSSVKEQEEKSQGEST